MSAEINKKYATALYQLAKDRELVDQTLEDLNAFQNVIKENMPLKRMLNNPLFKRSDHHRVIMDVLKRLNISSLTRKFIGVVIQNHRLRVLEDFISTFRTEVKYQRAQTRTDIRVAHPLSQTQHETLTTALKNLLGNKIDIYVTVEPQLLGGMVLKFGSSMIDSSLRTKIGKIHSFIRRYERL